MISSPLRRLDCSLVADGGGAIILVRREKARQLGKQGVRIRSMAMRCTHNGVAAMPDISDFCAREASEDAFEAAGAGPEDMDLAFIHDAFTISVLITLEAMAFCQPGRAGEYIRSGAAGIRGTCPLNTHGGLLSQAHVGGMLHFVEAVRQLRGSAGKRQIQDASLAVVSGNGGIFSVCGTMVLERAGA